MIEDTVMFLLVENIIILRNWYIWNTDCQIAWHRCFGHGASLWRKAAAPGGGRSTEQPGAEETGDQIAAGGKNHIWGCKNP